MSATESATDPTTPRKGSSLKSMIVEVLLITLIAVGAGAAFAWFGPLHAAAQSEGGKTSAASAPASSVTCGPETTALLDLPPVVTNIGSPSDVWVRMEASVIFEAKAMPHPETIAAEIATDELAYLRTVTLAQLQGPIGLANIRQDLTDRAMIRSGGKITELVLRTLVVQ